MPHNKPPSCFIAVTAVLVGCAWAAPHVAPVSAGSPLWAGTFGGQLSILPYARAGSGYACVSTCPTPINAYTILNAVGTTMNIFINPAQGANGCGINAQNYTVYNVQAHSGGAYPYYYGGTLVVGSQVLPVCFYMGPNSAGSINFIFDIDGKGSCPTSAQVQQCVCATPSLPALCSLHGPQAASCTNTGSGSVTQVWSGVFVQNVLPKGVFAGLLSVQPFTAAPGGGAKCGACPVITVNASYVWGNVKQTLLIQAAAGSGGGCTMPAANYLLFNIVDYGPSYPGYFRGFYSPSASQTISVCFVFNGAFTLLLDGQGTCPNPGAGAACYPATAGSVVQVFSGTYKS